MFRALTGVFAAVLIAATGVSASQQTQQTQQNQQTEGRGAATTTGPRQISPDVISGVWDYNDSLSVDAATGRPERAPRSATQRATGATTPTTTRSSTPPPRPPGGGGGGGGEGGGGDSFAEARRAMQTLIAAERRTYVRDLLEVPELLKIKASTAEVVIGDDLGRERTYPTDGRLQKYQLSAARYEARASWTETYFRKDIQGTNNFKMSETYFVSEDGRRLFVIIRVGDPKRPETLAGVNRVYDRVGSY